MQAGRLRHRLAIQAASEVRDDHGQATQSWATVATVWGHVEPLQGREQITAQQSDMDMPTRITIRRYAGLTTRYRVLFGTRIFNLVSVPDTDARDPMMELLSVEEEVR